MMDPGRQAVTGTASDHDANTWFEVTVTQVERSADEVVSLTLRSRDRATLPEWQPGAHIDVQLGADMVRQYSLCGDPDDLSSWRIAILREPDGRGGSAQASTLQPGDWLWVRGPRNHFPLNPAQGYLFIVGGIGITPILPMVRAVAQTGAPWRLYYGGRSRSSMAFTEELAQYGEHVRIYPQDESGLLDVGSILADAERDTLAYCCGPEGLLTAVTEQASDWPSDAVRMERFSARETAHADGDVPFEVECRNSEVTVTVDPGETILDAVERAGGVVTASSCREGICGTCEVTVLGGIPDHRDEVLTREEQEAGDVIMTCVSRTCTPRLVLDI